MGTIVKFTDLEVWKEAHKLTLLVYKYTNSFPNCQGIKIYRTKKL